MSFSLREVAASSYSGARALQWPHQGAKTGEDRCQLGNVECVRIGEDGILTLCKNKVVGLDEVTEGSLGQLVNVRGSITLGVGEASEDGEQAVGKALVQHCGCCVCESDC